MDLPPEYQQSPESLISTPDDKVVNADKAGNGEPNTATKLPVNPHGADKPSQAYEKRLAKLQNRTAEEAAKKESSSEGAHSTPSPGTKPVSSTVKWSFRIGNWIVSHVIAKLIVGFVLTILALAATKINHDELVIHTRFGKHVAGPLNPGLHFFFPYIDEIRRYSTVLQFLLITDKSVKPDITFEEVYFAEGVAVTTSDNVDAKIVLEVVFGIEKNPKTIDKFVESFGRVDSAYGTQKIGKLIADTTRGISRSLFSQVQVREAETNNLLYSEIIRDLSNNPSNRLAHLPNALGSRLNDATKELQHPYLSELGIHIHRLGYRFQPSKEFLAARSASGILLVQEKNREEIIAAEKQSALSALKAKEDLQKKELELASGQAEIYSKLPDGDRQKIVRKLIEQWDGRLPQILAPGQVSPIADLLQLLPPDTSTSQSASILIDQQRARPGRESK